MHALKELLTEQVSRGLQRRSITTPSKWALKYREMPKGRWSFERFPWLREPHDSTHETNIIQKGAQLGFTETVLNITLYQIDVKKQDCLYMLPTKTPDASDFSSARFDSALDLSDHLANLFNDTRNIGHKRSGAANLYIRGSKAINQIKSIPVGFLVMDEIEEFGPRAVPLALERLSGHDEKQIWMLSTPSIDEIGINLYYQRSTQDIFSFKCPSCHRTTNLIFPECLVITAEHLHDPRIHDTYIQCKECKTKLPHETKTEWLANGFYVSTYKDRFHRGFHVNQLYATTVSPREIAESYFKAQTNPADEQEFYNSKLGLTHVVDGANVIDSEITEAKRGHRSTDNQTAGIITMGVDVGTDIHYVIDKWFLPKKFKSIDVNSQAICRTIRFGKVKDFEELDDLIRRNLVLFTIIDANPDKRKAFELAARFPGLVKLCYYGRGVSGRQLSINSQEPTVTVDRTTWLDTSLGRFRSGKIELPIDISFEFCEHIKALVRIYDKDADGNPVGRYENRGRDDHYAHARNYSEIALLFAMGLAENQNISKV